MTSVFECPECHVPLEKVDKHGYFHLCPECKKDFPLYVLQAHEAAHKKTFMDNVRGIGEKIKKWL